MLVLFVPTAQDDLKIYALIDSRTIESSDYLTKFKREIYDQVSSRVSQYNLEFEMDFKALSRLRLVQMDYTDKIRLNFEIISQKMRKHIRVIRRNPAYSRPCVKGGSFQAGPKAIRVEQKKDRTLAGWDSAVSCAAS